MTTTRVKGPSIASRLMSDPIFPEFGVPGGTLERSVGTEPLRCAPRK